MLRQRLLVGCLLGGVFAVPTQGQEADLATRVQAALAKSRSILINRLERAHNGELALLCLAAIHDEVPHDDKVLGKALRRLRQARLSRTYDLALRLMVAVECPTFPGRKQVVTQDQRRLMRHLRRGKGFGYDKEGRGWDLSNTQYAVLGLRAAASLGVVPTEKQWRQVVRAAISAQDENGGFGYVNHLRPTESMTAAGIAVLQICSAQLGEKISASLGIKKRLDAAWKWVADHKGSIGDRKTDNCLYFHYGLERAAILSEVTEVDGKDWYSSGAEMLLRTQKRNGGWHSKPDMVRGKGEDGVDSVSTSFAILYLRRKFKKTLEPGPVTIGGGPPIHLLPEQATKAQADAAVEAAVSRGWAALPQVLRALRSKFENRRAAGAKALIRITGSDFGYNPHRTPEQNREAVQKAELRYFKFQRDNKK
ncbi:MAG: hypothetical protein VX951_03045 [Planctomycetota bacterium]|nr:hypothetical protein [Planctomycetota bacterium]